MNIEVEETQDEQVQSLSLDVDVKETSACGRHVTVTIPRDEVERYFSKQFDELVPKAEIPGFRPGKAPRKLVEKKFRKQLSDQVKGQLIMDSLAQVNEGQEFSAISEPDLDYEQVNLPEEGDFKYEFNIEVRPEFDVPEYKGLKLERPEHDFTDADIDKEIQRIARRNSPRRRWCPLTNLPKGRRRGFLYHQLQGRRWRSDSHQRGEFVWKSSKPSTLPIQVALRNSTSLISGASAGDTRSVKVEMSDFADNESATRKNSRTGL